jgi:hypothetical protein
MLIVADLAAIKLNCSAKTRVLNQEFLNEAADKP